jgi:chromosome segregation ATPase
LNSNQTPEIAEQSTEESSRIETQLRDLWERLRALAQHVHDLRDERKTLLDKIAFLEQEFENHKVALQKKEVEIRSLRAEHLQLVNSSGKNSITDEDKEYLKGRIRDLIVKINSYL